MAKISKNLALTHYAVTKANQKNIQQIVRLKP